MGSFLDSQQSLDVLERLFYLRFALLQTTLDGFLLTLLINFIHLFNSQVISALATCVLCQQVDSVDDGRSLLLDLQVQCADFPEYLVFHHVRSIRGSVFDFEVLLRNVEFEYFFVARNWLGSKWQESVPCRSLLESKVMVLVQSQDHRVCICVVIGRTFLLFVVPQVGLNVLRVLVDVRDPLDLGLVGG